MSAADIGIQTTSEGKVGLISRKNRVENQKKKKNRGVSMYQIQCIMGVVCCAIGCNHLLKEALCACLVKKIFPESSLAKEGVSCELSSCKNCLLSTPKYKI